LSSEMPATIGGVLCLDFVNTVDPRHATDRLDFLTNYDHLIGWARHVEALDDAEARRLLKLARRQPRDANLVMNRTIALREALYGLFAGAIVGEDPAPSDCDRLNLEVAQTMANARIDHSVDGFWWTWDNAADRLDRVLWSVVRSATDLLVEGPLERVRECPGDGGTCGWLFLDVSKNATRRWCEMRTCGNRAKARRFYGRRTTD